jgi:hypothetical protein
MIETIEFIATLEVKVEDGTDLTKLPGEIANYLDKMVIEEPGNEPGPYWITGVWVRQADHEGLLEALQAMTKEFGNQRFNVRKDYSKMVAVEAAKRAIAKAGG